GAYLLEADAGVSTHYEHLETTFSFRTRILGYLWARLPIVTTAGDSFGDLVAAEKLGIAVHEQDVTGLADALETALFDKKARAEFIGNVDRVREQFTWENVLAPLVEFCRNPIRAADKSVRDTGSAVVPHEMRVRVPDRKKLYGVRHDLGRAVHYFRTEGPRSVAGKIKRRLQNR
ncbi:MAG: glycosyl transferase, partial [Curtobacterium sp.]